jgi:hypothetical protein
MLQKLRLNPCNGIRPEHRLLNHWKYPIVVEMCNIIFPWDTTGRDGPTDIFQYFEAEIMELMKPYRKSWGLTASGFNGIARKS